MNSRTQIIATIGPASGNKDILRQMMEHNMDVVRLNFSWGTYEEHKDYIKNVREIAEELNKKVPVIVDLSGPRIQNDNGHEFNKDTVEVITEKDLKDLDFAVENNVDYVALSFVGSGRDVLILREEMEKRGKVIPIIAKIERAVALVNLGSIIQVSDAIMIARGDLGNEVAIEKIPFIEKEIIEKCKIAGKPVIVATQVLMSMVENPIPTRAEMTDVAYAVMLGADVIMLSDETAMGKYPLEAVKVMERGIKEAEEHWKDKEINSLF